MNFKIILPLVAILLLTCCIDELEEELEVKETTTTLRKVTVATTPPTTATTTLKEKSDLEKCSEEETKTERDHCYFNLALKEHHSGTCQLIESESVKKICLENTEIEKGGKSTTLQGYVMEERTARVVPRLTVRAISKTSNEEVAWTNTNAQGFYSMKVPSRDTYILETRYDNKDYQYEIYARTGYTHEIWFKV